MKLWKNLKSAIQSWSVAIPEAVKGDPSAVLRCINVYCIPGFKIVVNVLICRISE